MDGVKSLANKKKDHHILQLKLSNDLYLHSIKKYMPNPVLCA